MSVCSTTPAVCEVAGGGEGEHDALLSRLEREYEMMVKLAHDHDDDEQTATARPLRKVGYPRHIYNLSDIHIHIYTT